MAVVKQADAAVRTEIDARGFQIERTFAAGADRFGQPRQRHVITEFFAALCIGQSLGLLLPLAVLCGPRPGPERWTNGAPVRLLIISVALALTQSLAVALEDWLVGAGQRVSSSDVSAWLNQLFPNRAAERHAVLEAARKGEEVAIDTALFSDTGSNSRPSRVSGPGVAPELAPTTVSPPPGARRRGGLLLGVGAAVAVFVVGLGLTLKPSTPTTTAEPDAGVVVAVVEGSISVAPPPPPAPPPFDEPPPEPPAPLPASTTTSTGSTPRCARPARTAPACGVTSPASCPCPRRSLKTTAAKTSTAKTRRRRAGA